MKDNTGPNTTRGTLRELRERHDIPKGMYSPSRERRRFVLGCIFNELQRGIDVRKAFGLPTYRGISTKYLREAYSKLGPWRRRFSKWWFWFTLHPNDLIGLPPKASGKEIINKQRELFNVK